MTSYECVKISIKTPYYIHGFLPESEKFNFSGKRVLQSLLPPPSSTLPSSTLPSSPPPLLPSQACVTVFSNDGYWYRAEVTDLPAHDIAIVKYVDYGNSGQVACGALRRAKPNYLALPAQAIQCRLANLKPAGSVSVSE